jgi:hypothetical protein
MTIAEDKTTPDVPVFVPVALPLDEARALFNAARATFATLTQLGQAGEHGGELARGMMRLATAIDEKLEQQ